MTSLLPQLRASLEAQTVTLPPDLYWMARDVIERWDAPGFRTHKITEDAIALLRAITQNAPEPYEPDHAPRYEGTDPRNYSHARRRRIEERRAEEAEDEA